MPKILLYITARVTWIFLFYGTDFNENRAHVHVGKKGMDKYCKLWLDPDLSVADAGDLTPEQIKQVTTIAAKYQDKLLAQWELFKQGKTLKMITIKK